MTTKPNSTETTKVIKIGRINIYESPILSVTYENKVAHLVLDTGATASLISLAKATELKLKILPTVHRAVQVDGISDLKVLGEVHTEFQRNSLSLQFSGLVVNKLGTEILAGTNFHKENDIYSRMAKDTIVIKGTNIFQSTPVEIMKLDEGSSSAKLVEIKRTQILMPGELLQLELPPSCPANGVYLVEPKFGHGEPLCHPQIVKAVNNKINVVIKNTNDDAPVKVTKNSKPIQVRETKVDVNDNEKFEKPNERYYERFKDTLPDRKKEKETLSQKIEKIEIDQARTMTPVEKKLFEETIAEFEEVFNDDLPGYNNYFGVVHASIQFASRARPTPHKTRMPSYGVLGQKLFNQKALGKKRSAD